MKKILLFLISLLIILCYQACYKLEPKAPVGNKTLDGPLEGLTYAQVAHHGAGDEAFTSQVFTAQTGLGPLFVSTSCGSCHAGDGKGHPFTTLTRFGKTDTLTDRNGTPGGPQLQNRAIQGYQPEQLPPSEPHSKFTPPANSGLGYIELVSDEDILAMASANVNNADGVRGHPNWNHIPSYVTPAAGALTQGSRYICRFGKKAAAYNLFHQTVVAYNQDIGIATTYDPLDTYSQKNIGAEIPDKTVLDVVFYLQTLKAPIQRQENDAMIANGKEIFIQTGCEVCHKQTLKTGYSPIAQLSNQTFHPYTDLLVHDMGPQLDDGYTEGTAKTSEWRTPPLWGLGLSPNSQGGQYYLLHDGRANTVEDAIIMHGGEANAAKNRFLNLSQADKGALIKFLKSL